jgi:RNA polymerase sigma factor (sigma-70 family)
LYNTIYPKVKAYVTRNSGTEDDALDIFQDAIVCLCKYIKQGKYNEKYEVAAFLYSVSRNLWINKVKKESRTTELQENTDISEEYDFSNDIITEQKAKTIREVIRQLGEKCYELLQYAFYQRKSNSEICEAMGFATVNAVKTQKYKCKQKLLSLVESNKGFKEVFE